MISLLCLALACVLCSCDMEGLVGEVLGEQIQGEQDQTGGMFGAVMIGTDENGNYIVQGENGTVIVEDFEIIQGSGNSVVIGGNGDFSISMTNPLAEVDAYKAADFEETDQVTDYVKITVRDYGEIVVRLHSGIAPETVENFKMLVEQGFYNGLIFHRVIQNFMIQGGGFDESGAQHKTGAIKGEFTSNGFANNLKHARGVISMARTMDPNSASSQFFICDVENSHLDGDYAAFGVVVAGMDVVDQIAAVETDGSDCPRSAVVIESAVFVTPVK